MNGNTGVNNIDIMKDIFNVLRKSVFAGMFIGIAGWGYLVNPVLGMFLFCVGLIGIIKYNLFLFTGSAGFIYERKDVLLVIVCLFGNLIGCAILALLAQLSPYELYNASTQIVESRLYLGWLNCGLLSIGCGILMSFAVRFAKFAEVEVHEHLSNWLPLLFAVPAFILCGFPHCVADAFYNLIYICETPTTLISFKEILIYYSSIVIGNFIGCNCFRILS